MLLLALTAHAADTADSLYDAPWGSLSLAVTASGAHTSAETLNVLRPVGPTLGACFPDRTTVTRLDASFTVDPGGHARDITAMATPGASKVEACVEQALGAPALAWPAASGPTQVDLHLTPVDLMNGIGGLIGRKGTQLGTAGGDGVDTRERPPPVVLAAGVRTDPWGPILLGALDKALVDEVVYASGPAFGTCWTEARGRAPKLAGRVVLKFVIEATGKVSSVTVKSTTVNDPTLEACAARVAEGWTFPGPKGGGIVIASYPFDFSAS